MKVEKYLIKGWEDSKTGLLISENDSWILVKHIPVDYVIDGYKIYNKKYIEKRVYTKNEKKIEKVLILKRIKENIPQGFSFKDTIGLLKWVEKKYGIFEFQDQDETELFYGKINRTYGNNLIIDMIMSDGDVETNYDYEFDIDEIRSITFKTDYHTSVKLLWQDKIKK